jgi:hypothetical protein
LVLFEWRVGDVVLLSRLPAVVAVEEWERRRRRRRVRVRWGGVRGERTQGEGKN